MKVILSLILLIMMISVSGCVAGTSTTPASSTPDATTPKSTTFGESDTDASQALSFALMPARPFGQPSLSQTAAAADLIVLGSITNLKYELLFLGLSDDTEKVPHTIYTLTVEKVVKGNPDLKAVLIKKPGGKDPQGRNILDVEDEHYYGLGSTMLVALHAQKDGTYMAWSDDELWYKGETIVPRVDSDVAIGRLIAAMTSNNIPVDLPQSDWPPIPVGPVTRPAN